jgi:hypothetical protein
VDIIDEAALLAGEFTTVDDAVIAYKDEFAKELVTAYVDNEELNEKLEESANEDVPLLIE